MGSQLSMMMLPGGCAGYIPQRILNGGSNSKVIVAKKRGDEKLYSLKTVTANSSEIKILQDIKGVDNVVQYVETFLEKEYIVVYEYCHGVELFDYINANGPLDEILAKKIFRQLCSAMCAVHNKGIVHRDLKPENIIIHQGNVTILDWGYAFYPAETDVRSFCGSPAYASPEIINAKHYDGPEIDVWSLGCILYVMLAAKLPFEAEAIPDLFEQIRSCSVTYPNYFSKQIINLLEQIFIVDDRITIKKILDCEWLI